MIFRVSLYIYVLCVLPVWGFSLAPAVRADNELAAAEIFLRDFNANCAPAGFSPLPAAHGAAAVAVSDDYAALPAYAFTNLNELNSSLIDAATATADIAIFSITTADNPDALIRAAERGVSVRVLIDESHVYPRADPQIQRLMQTAAIELRTLRGTRSWGVNHNKIGIFDNSAVATGSYNWTYSATFFNYENMVVARQPAHVAGYTEYFEWMWSKARTLAEGASPELPEGYYGLPPQDPAPAQSLNGVPVPAYLFSPGSRAEERLAALIDAAAISLDAVTFTFSSKILADAVLRARDRGVKVRFLMDKNMAATSLMASQLFAGGVDFRWRAGRADKGALHNKFLILDGELLQTGSFNWTVNASVNSFENMIFVTEQPVVKAYQAVYDELYDGALRPSAGEFHPPDNLPALKTSK